MVFFFGRLSAHRSPLQRIARFVRRIAVVPLNRHHESSFRTPPCSQRPRNTSTPTNEFRGHPLKIKFRPREKMHSTAHSLQNSICNSTPLSSGVRYDYGLNIALYPVQPSTEQIQCLISAYAQFLELYGPEKLHDAFIQHCVNRELNVMIERPQCFDWVRFSYNANGGHGVCPHELK